ncbi:MAG: DUF4105 domain-containing protein, partial [Pseudomonadota bacterium]|nr:DUF4105 domain-containing protein [Pseudomonadota bacterium]
MPKLLTIAALILCSTLAQAAFKPPAPDRSEVYLLTAGLGAAIYARYGHTILQVSAPNRDYYFNWGIFDYRDPVAFGFVFFKGILTYKLGIDSWRKTKTIYQRQNRWLIRNKINLTPNQKQTLYQILQTNLRPENIEYSYQYFYNNCSTIVRDYLDRVLHGSVKARTADAPIAMTFRHYVRDNLNYPAWISFGLEVLMNGRIDVQLHQWEEMFYPIKLQEHLRNLTAVDDRGQPTAIPLLGADESLLQGVNFPSSSVQLVVVVPSIMLLLLFLALLLYKYISPRWVIGVLLIIAGVGGGVIGILMLVSWLHSEHLDLHHNLNLLQFMPTDLLVLPSIGMALLLRRPRFLHRVLRPLAYVHLGAFIVMLVIACVYGVIGVEWQAT